MSGRDEPFTHEHPAGSGKVHTHVGDPFHGTKDYLFEVTQPDGTVHRDLIAAKTKARARAELERRVKSGHLLAFREVRA